MIKEELKSKFKLDIKEIEENVFEVQNKKNLTNTEELESYLKKCILITSDIKKLNKNNDTGIYSSITSIYFIILDYDNKELMLKYHHIAKKEIDKDSTISSYWERPELCNSVDTLYTAREIGKHE